MITIYTKTECPYCIAAKHWLQQNGLRWDEVNLDKDEKARQKLVQTYPDIKSVPQIIVNKNGDDIRVGGYNDISKNLSLFEELK